MSGMSGRRLKKPPSVRKKNQPPESMKNFLTQWELRRKTDRSIDKKPPNPGGKLRRKTDPKFELLGYCFLAFLLEPLVEGPPRFRLVLRGRAVRGRTIVGWDHRRLRLSELEPSGVEPSEVEPSGVGTIGTWAIGGQAIVGWAAALKRGEIALERRKKIVQSVKNLLTQWELRRKTDVENPRFV